MANMPIDTQAPGKPGEPARWAASGKDGVGTGVSTASSVWFTLRHGCLTEIFYPFVDTACTRDLQLLVSDGHDFFSAASSDTYSKIEYLAAGVPAFRITNTCKQGRYRTVSDVLADPRRSTILMEVQFQPLHGNLDDSAVRAAESTFGKPGGGQYRMVG